MVDIEILKDNYFVNMAKCPYELKKGGIVYIHPILVKDYLRYSWAKTLLTIDKNAINDIEIIQMSYLGFVINKLLITEDNQDKFWWLFKLCLNEENIAIGDNCVIIKDDNGIVKYVISSKEFDDISKIIQAQNDPNFDDRYVNPEVKEMMMEYYKIKYQGIHAPNLEQRKAFVSSKIGKSFYEINELPYREFDLIYDACKDSEIYIGQKIIQGSQKYDVKEDIKHPLYAPKKDMYEELFTETSTLANKGINGAEQLTAMNIVNSNND